MRGGGDDVIDFVPETRFGAVVVNLVDRDSEVLDRGVEFVDHPGDSLLAVRVGRRCGGAFQGGADAEEPLQHGVVQLGADALPVGQYGDAAPAAVDLSAALLN